QVALIPGPRGRSELGPGHMEGGEAGSRGSVKIKALKEAVATEVG
ncbi:unnamed protein product, partial [Choristocarpus tenellus]